MELIRETVDTIGAAVRRVLRQRAAPPRELQFVRVEAVQALLGQGWRLAGREEAKHHVDGWCWLERDAVSEDSRAR